MARGQGPVAGRHVVLGLILLSFLRPSFSLAADDLSKDIAALKAEIRAAQEKITKAKVQEGGASAVTRGTAPQKVQPPSPRLAITSFTKCVPPGRVAMSMGRSGEPPAERSSTTIIIGESVCLSWKIEGCHVGSVTERLTTGAGAPIPLDPGVRVDEGGGCFRMHNQKSVSPRETTTYTLTASGVPVMPGSAASKTFTVHVRRPILTVLPPQVNLSDLTVRFFTRNDGDLDFGPDGVRVEYRIFLQSRTDYRDIGVASFTRNLSLRVGQREELGERRLPERSVLSRFTEMIIRVSIRGGTYSGQPADFSIPLTPVESVITSDLIRIFGSALTGRIHINNYDSSVSSERIRRIPARANDCFIELSGRRRSFSVDYVRLRGSVLGITRLYLALINDLNASLGGRDFLSVVEGRLKMHIVFDPSGGREIKGWLQDLFDTDLWNDEQGPDVDVTRLEMDVFLTLGLREGRITYTEAQVEPTIALRVAGGWEWVDPFVRDHLRDILRNEVRDQMAAILMADAFRQRIEDELANALRAIGISRIESLRAEGDRVIVTYYR